MKFYTPLAAVCLSLPALAAAQIERDLESHEHGSATLDVVIDGTTVSLELYTPWDNLVGFEHAPSTDEQRASVQAARELLNQPDQLFTLNGGDCSVDDVSLDSNLPDGAQNEGHSDEPEEAQHDEMAEEMAAAPEDEMHEQVEEAHHEEEADDEQAEGHDEGESETHSSAQVGYTYTCADTSKLSTIDMALFDQWEGLEDLDVQLAGPGGQAAAELGPDQQTLNIDQVQ